MDPRRSPALYPNHHHNNPRPHFPPLPPSTHASAASPATAAASHRIASPAYAHQRRTSDAPYHRPSHAVRDYPPEPSHSRAQSASSLPTARELSRTMPPPTSPPQQPGPHQHSQHQHQHQQQPHVMGYGPPPPRPPPVAVGPPSAFPSGRELPALSSIARSGSASIGGSSMSISSMLGGPPPASREAQSPAASSQHYSSHSAPTSASVSGPGFAQSIQASPRMHSASSEYAPFRRPQTPELQRPYDPRGGAAPSPRGHYATTPDVQRYGTPQQQQQQQPYHSRHPSSNDPSRDQGRIQAAPPPPGQNAAAASRPYGGMAPRPMEVGRAPGPEDAYGRREEVARSAPGMDYGERTALRPYPYDDRYRSERERQAAIGLEQQQREREGRERAYSGGDPNRHPLAPHDQAHREPPVHQSAPYGAPPAELLDRRDPRDPRWGRPETEASYRPAPMDHQRPHPDYPPTSGPYAPHNPSAYPTAPPERFPPPSHPAYPPSSSGVAGPPQPHESPERARMEMHHSQQQQPPPPPPRSRPLDDVPPPLSSAPFGGGGGGGHGHHPFDPSRNRTVDDPSGPGIHQRNLLAIQEINRKGRVSPLPQAVQGAQPQQPGPAAEPGIKSEFGRMFAGIGSGVGGMGGVSSPVTSAPMAQYINAALAKRDDDNPAPDAGPDGATKGARGRRRKLNTEESRDDDSSGRLTPVGRGTKRPKGHAHHHHQRQEVNANRHFYSHHHHHHHHAPEGTASPTVGITTFKNFKGVTPVTSPTEKAPSAAHHHHHHHHTPRATQPAQAPKPAQSPPNLIPPKPRTIVSSKAVLEQVAGHPRHHLGDFIYEPDLKAGRLLPHTPTHRGFSSNPKPLPLDLIKGKENCTLTVKVSRVHLSSVAREEITARAFLWGTDVYTDDSDVVAACIHGGWIKGEWTEDVDTTLLDLEGLNGETKRRKVKSQESELAIATSEGLISAPPVAGPMLIPAERDLHVNVLILPRLVKYASSTRYGITSREFGGEYGSRHAVHDGLSYMVKSIRWVQNGAQPQARLRGKGRRERMREQAANYAIITGVGRTESLDGKPSLGSEISRNWAKRKNTDEAPEGKRRHSEGDKENQPDDKMSEAHSEGQDRDRDVEMRDLGNEEKAAVAEEK
ncbi:hypothetical protein TARUN_5775 [Trichoderma arundinaceum]|uniref:Histone deacetylation rxt3 n=1 Tax=Trichoderma arundinaceum TaxID=490622 RepID=A0A395NK81_TRIAR|nr:hypothetical protein TARUN_5775 [Trichoderma arundinaceum]